MIAEPPAGPGAPYRRSGRTRIVVAIVSQLAAAILTLLFWSFHRG